MGVLDNVARNVSARLIGQFGKSVQVTYRTDEQINPVTGTAAYDPGQGETVGPTETTATLTVLMGDTSRLVSLGFALAGEVRSGDLLVDLAAQTFEEAFGASAEPKPGDSLTIDGAKYRVHQVKPQWGGERIAMYSLFVRR